MPQEKKELPSSTAIIVAGVIVAGAILFANRFPISAPQPAAAVQGDQPAVAINVAAPSAADHIVGSPSAPIVLVEYGDFECPYCSLVHPTIKKIVADSQGQIAWVFRNFPLTSIHPEALPAALAAECVADQLGNTAYWKFVDTLYADQSKLSGAYYSQVAVGLGANKTTFDSCVSTQKFTAKIQADETEATKNGGQGTPYTVVYSSGKQLSVSGAQPEANFMAVINQVKARQ